MPCPAGVDIPYCFSAYNDRYIYDDKNQKFFYLGVTTGMDGGGGRSYASACKSCGACEKKCPQGLPIRQLLKDVSKEMEPFYFKPASSLLQSYIKLRRRKQTPKSE
jgi:predicted aldo/keto reductase-like oxidoreductase